MYIGEKETKWLLIILITSQIFVSGINVFTKASGTSAVIVAFLCSALVFGFLFFLDKMRFSKDVGFLTMMKECYGKFSVVIGALLSALSALNCSMRLKMFTGVVTDVILPDSPQIFVLIFFALTMISISFSGLEPVTRYAIPAGIVIVGLALIVGIFNIEGYKLTNIHPILGNGNEGIALSSGSIRMFADIFYLFIFSDYFRKKGALRRVGFNAIAVSGVIISIITLLFTLCVPYPASLSFDYPFFRLSSLANTSVLFQRLDGAVYIIWLFSGFLSTGALALLTMIIFEKTFGLSDYKGAIHSFVFVISAFTLIEKNYFDLVNSLFATFVFLLLAVTTVIYRFKMISGDNKDEN